MTDFVALAEEDVLSAEEAAAAGSRQGALCGQLSALKVDLEALVRFFGEDPSNCKPQDVLKIIGGTAHDYGKAKADLVKDKEKSDKRARRQQAAIGRSPGADRAMAG